MSKRLLVAAVLSTLMVSSVSVAATYENMSNTNGGAIPDSSGIEVNIDAESSFIHNTATAQNYGGGAIYNNSGAVITIGDGTSFVENYLNQPITETTDREYRSAGGAIASWNSGTVNIGSEVSFKGNGYNSITGEAAWASGGAIYVDTNRKELANLSINEGSSFTGNVSGSLGGAIYVADADTSIDSVSFEGNKAGSWGGAIFGAQYYAIDGNNVTVTGNSSFKNNSAGNYGGAIASQYTTLNIGDENSKISFDGNSAGLDGGAVHITTDADEAYKAKSNFENTTFTNNEAVTGSGGAIYNPGELNATNVSFGELITDAKGNITGGQNGNTAAVQGGAIMNAAGAVATFKGETIFADNYAGQGGAIYNEGTVSVGGGSQFIGNSAAVNGGAIYNAGIANLDTSTGDITFANNTAKNVANDIYAAANSATNITSSYNVSIGSG